MTNNNQGPYPDRESVDMSSGTVIKNKKNGVTTDIFIKRTSGHAEEPLDKYNAPIALDAAAAFNDTELVERSVETGFSPKNTKGEVLHNALTKGHTEVLSQLLEHGANPNHKTPEGRSLLETSIKSKNPDAFKSLLKHGADPNTKNNKDLSMLEVAHDSKNVGAFKALLKAGATLDDKVIEAISHDRGRAKEGSMAIPAQKALQSNDILQEVTSYLSGTETQEFDEVKRQVSGYLSGNADDPTIRGKDSFIDAVIASRRSTLQR